MRRATAIAVFATLVGMVFGLGSVSADSTRPTLKNYQHVFVIMMENTGYDALIGNPNAPWINDAAGRYGLATNYTGVIHPSQPNYIASTAGITGADTDNDETLDVPNLVDQLESHSKTWKSYSQSFSLCNGNVLPDRDVRFQRHQGGDVRRIDVQHDAEGADACDCARRLLQRSGTWW